MTKEKDTYNPTPGDYNTEILSGTGHRDSAAKSMNQKHEPQSKIYSHPIHIMDGQGNDLNSSKPNPVTGPIAMNNTDAFEYKNPV